MNREHQGAAAEIGRLRAAFSERTRPCHTALMHLNNKIGNGEIQPMLAVIEKVEEGYLARFDRVFKHSAANVWAALTENDRLPKWMPNLRVKDLRKGGSITFDMMDGTNFDLTITDFLQHSVLEFTWGDGRVRFEVYPKPEGCLLVLKEFFPALNDHTAKDLPGWHVCLDVLNALLNGREMDFPRGDWEKWHEKYAGLVDRMKRESER